MIYAENDAIENLIIHKVGNKILDENLVLSKQLVKVDSLIAELLIRYFLTPFKAQEYYNFYHESDLELNELYMYANKIFTCRTSFNLVSENIAKHLYERSTHPNIKGGELYIVHFKKCIVDGLEMEAMGIFKSETKETYLKILPTNGSYEIDSDNGININKLDKGCIIFNTEKEKGYLVAIVDNLSKGTEAKYWVDDFLQVRQRQDEYYNTQNVMSMYKTFVTKELPQQFEVTKADQAELINESVKFFKGKEEFDFEDFGNEVLKQPEVIQSFNDFSNKYQQERDIEIADNFTISDAAVKKQSRAFKSVIKLDKNFHIYVHGNNQYIKKGYDETTGMHYYQLFFKEEQ
nr:nucleoid-associated protein [uncultured Alistipes sp.]